MRWWAGGGSAEKLEPTNEDSTHSYPSIPNSLHFAKLRESEKGRKVTGDQTKKSEAGRTFKFDKVRTSVQTRQSGFYWCEVEPSRSAGVCALAPMDVAARVPSLCGQLMTPNQAFRAQRNGGQEMDFSFVCEHENSM